jgi:hypothetical protein
MEYLPWNFPQSMWKSVNVTSFFQKIKKLFPGGWCQITKTTFSPYLCLTWRMPSSGMWRRVDLVWTDFSKELIASIFRIEKSATEVPAWATLQQPAQANSSLADFSALKMEAIRSSETSVHTRSTRLHIPEDSILHSHHCENLKSYMCLTCLILFY